VRRLTANVAKACRSRRQRAQAEAARVTAVTRFDLSGRLPVRGHPRRPGACLRPSAGPRHRGPFRPVERSPGPARRLTRIATLERIGVHRDLVTDRAGITAGRPASAALLGCPVERYGQNHSGVTV
jgi:hypothetical protein